MLQGDIKDLSENILRQAIGNRTVDIVVGGPPCQSYSTLGKRQMDARANLFMEYKRVLRILHPRAFLFENVKGILSMDKGALFEHVRKEFEDIGYSLQYKILNAVDYGVPQLRERVILVGFLGENAFQYPEPTHGEGLLPYVTLQNALKDLPALECGEESTMYTAPPDNEFLSWVRQSGSDTLTEHKSPNNSAHLRRIMAALKDGQGKDDLPEELRPKSGFKNTYAKLWWELVLLSNKTKGFFGPEICNVEGKDIATARSIINSIICERQAKFYSAKLNDGVYDTQYAVSEYAVENWADDIVPPVVINSCIWAIVANTAAEMQKDNRFLRRKEICDTEFLEIATRIYNELLGFAARKYEILDIGE